MAATHITVTQAAARGSHDTRAPYQQQWVKNLKLDENSKLGTQLYPIHRKPPKPSATQVCGSASLAKLGCYLSPAQASLRIS